MTNKEAIEILKPLTEYSVNNNGIGTFPMVSTSLQVEAINLAITALENNRPQEDNPNAPAVEVLKDITEINCDITKEQLLNALRPKGKWIDVPCERDLLFNTGIKYTCSVCGKFNSNGHSSFCPDCGADMRGD